MDVVLQTQKAVYNVLKADSALSGLIASVYDVVPDGAAYPYVTIGDAQVKDSSALEVRGFEIDLAISVYSQAVGRLQVLQVLERIFALISTQDLVVTGYLFVSANFVGMNTRRLNNGDVDGEINFKILLKESA